MPKLDRETAKAVNDAEGSAYTLLDEDKYRLRLDKVVVAPKPDKNGNTFWIWIAIPSIGSTPLKLAN